MVWAEHQAIIVAKVEDGMKSRKLFFKPVLFSTGLHKGVQQFTITMWKSLIFQTGSISEHF